MAVDVRIREISLGGLSLESDIEFPLGAVHAFELVLGDGARVDVSAEARYSRPVREEAHGRYVTGFRFLEPDEATDQQVPKLVDGLS